MTGTDSFSRPHTSLLASERPLRHVQVAYDGAQKSLDSAQQ